MKSMMETMAFINSFLPTVCYVALALFAVLFLIKNNQANKESESTESNDKK